MQIKLKHSDEDYKKLNVSYSQLKLLNQQTENVLMDIQAQLEFSKCENAEKDSQTVCLNKTIDKLHDDVQKLGEEIRMLKTSKCSVEREKAYYMVSLKLHLHIFLILLNNHF